ncbi:MAG: hypothetical protein U0Q16_30765 [Bryobacteraceae bacterium]
MNSAAWLEPLALCGDASERAAVLAYCLRITPYLKKARERFKDLGVDS